jgi:hypothetical protein
MWHNYLSVAGQGNRFTLCGIREGVLRLLIKDQMASKQKEESYEWRKKT